MKKFFKECFWFRLKRKVLNFRSRDENEDFLYELKMMQFRFGKYICNSIYFVFLKKCFDVEEENVSANIREFWDFVESETWKTTGDK